MLVPCALSAPLGVVVGAGAGVGQGGLSCLPLSLGVECGDCVGDGVSCPCSQGGVFSVPQEGEAVGLPGRAGVTGGNVKTGLPGLGVEDSSETGDEVSQGSFTQTTGSVPTG